LTSSWLRGYLPRSLLKIHSLSISLNVKLWAKN
jgi:hypothetical protein